MSGHLVEYTRTENVPARWITKPIVPTFAGLLEYFLVRRGGCRK